MDPLLTLLVVLVVIVIVAWFVVAGFFLIGENQVGILTRRALGTPMPQGQVIARRGQVGVQADTLVPGLYWRMPFLWRIEKMEIINIPDGQIGVVEAIDGQPLPKGRVVGDEVECNQFQDARMFLDGDGTPTARRGHKGPQGAILRPGKYRVNTRLFLIGLRPATLISIGSFGVVSAQDGRPMPANLQVAPPSKGQHSYFQKGQEFLDGEGYRGPQLDTLQAGLYYINPLLFTVQGYKLFEVPPGSVAVLRSNVGAELTKSTGGPVPVADPARLLSTAPLHDSVEMLVPLTTDKGVRGIYKEPLAPGVYNLNPVAYTAYLVPTSAVMIDWADEPSRNEEEQKELFQFGSLGVTSKDGFAIAVEVRLVTRIDPSNAAFIIARFGSVRGLIEQIIHPVIDAEFRNNAGSKKALEFVQSRTDLQKEALDKAKDAFGKYNVEAQNLLISQIKMPPELMATQTQKEIAMQQQAQYEEQAKAANKQIAVQEMLARAAKQPEVVAALLQIDINKNRASAMVEEANGIRDSTRIKAEGDKSALVLIGDGEGAKSAAMGEGQAKAVEAVGLAQGRAYRAQTEVLGPDKVALVRVMEAVRDGKIAITPTTLFQMSGDKDGGSAGSLLTAYFARVLAGMETGSAAAPSTSPPSVPAPTAPAPKKS
jgi:regulator of protease activity HflC (stomatin/prohibitin superfamily)